MQEQIIHGRNFYDLGVNPNLKFNIFTSWVHPVGVGRRLQLPVRQLVQWSAKNNKLQRHHQPLGAMCRRMQPAICSSTTG